MSRAKSREARLSGPAGHAAARPGTALLHSPGPRRSMQELLTALRKVLAFACSLMWKGTALPEETPLMLGASAGSQKQL